MTGRRDRGGNVRAKVDLVKGNLVNDLVIDRTAVVRACVVVEIVLNVPSELENVVPFDPGHVVTQHFILAVPDTLPRALVIDVIRNQGRGAFSASGIRAVVRSDLKGATEPRKLRWVILCGPLPPVP